jgi:hypothetical protein
VVASGEFDVFNDGLDFTNVLLSVAKAIMPYFQHESPYSEFPSRCLTALICVWRGLGVNL